MYKVSLIFQKRDHYRQAYNKLRKDPSFNSYMLEKGARVILFDFENETKGTLLIGLAKKYLDGFIYSITLHKETGDETFDVTQLEEEE